LILLCCAPSHGAKHSNNSSIALFKEDQLQAINGIRRTIGANALTQMVKTECLAEPGH
jgi:hypothetical protein